MAGTVAEPATSAAAAGTTAAESGTGWPGAGVGWMSTARDGFRRLRRVPDDRVIAGVCTGLGRDLGIDPVLLRVTLVLLTIFGGVGLVLYLAAWALIPKAEQSELEPGGAFAGPADGLSTGTSRRSARWSWSRLSVAALAVLAGLITLSWWGSWQTFSLLMLAVIGLIALSHRQSGPGRTGTTGTVSAGPAVDGSPTSSVAGVGAAGASTGTDTSGHREASPAHPGWPRRAEPTGEDAVHTAPISTGWPGGQVGPHADRGADASTAGDRSDQDPPEQSPTADQQPARDRRAARPGHPSWRSFEPAPDTFWDQPDPLGLRDDPADQNRSRGVGDPTTPFLVGTSQPPANATVARQPRRPKRRGQLVLPLLTLFGVLLATGLVGATGEPPASVYIATSLGVIGLGVLAGTWLGRSTTLIVSGILALVALLPTTLADLAQPHLVDAQEGSLHRVPASIEEIDPRYEIGAGKIHLDLTQVPFSDGDHAETALELGTGQVIVVLPPNVDVDGNIEVGAGELTLFGESKGGLAHSRSALDLGRDGKGGGKLELTIESGFGGVEVRRADR